MNLLGNGLEHFGVGFEFRNLGGSGSIRLLEAERLDMLGAGAQDGVDQCHDVRHVLLHEAAGSDGGSADAHVDDKNNIIENINRGTGIKCAKHFADKDGKRKIVPGTEEFLDPMEIKQRIDFYVYLQNYRP